MRHLGILLLVAVASGTSAPSATAATRRVPSEYGTINQALDASTPGDTVVVAPGVYDQCETRLINGVWFSSVAFLKGGVCLLSEAGADVTTLRLDATGGSPIVLMGFGEVGSAEVSGFAVTGTATGLRGMSYTFGERCVLRHCIFFDIGSGGTGEIALGGTMSDVEVYGCRFENIDGGSGSAISQTSGTLLVEDSEFLNCRQGAVSVRWDSVFPHATGLTVRRCRFLGNTKTTGGGGAVFARDYGSIVIEDSWFQENESIGTSALGGAIALFGSVSDDIVRRCTFVGNYAGNGEGGAAQIRCWTITMEENTFFGNRVNLDFTAGASAVDFQGGNYTFRDNVIAANTGDQAVSIYGISTMESSCNVYWANPLGNTSGFPMDETDLDADPQFCDAPALDFTVSETSPCLPGNGHASCTERIGAWGQGCGVIAVDPVSWGRLKSGFRGGNEVRP